MGGAGRGAAPLEGQRSSIAVLLELDYRQPVTLPVGLTDYYRWWSSPWTLLIISLCTVFGKKK